MGLIGLLVKLEGLDDAYALIWTPYDYVTFTRKPPFNDGLILSLRIRLPLFTYFYSSENMIICLLPRKKLPKWDYYPLST